MSVDYASGLSEYDNKGKVGLPESFDTQEDRDVKVAMLVEWLKASKHVVVHTGAGISTSAGIPDFRGPKGVWTLESKGLKPETSVTFDTAQPTFTHRALASLEQTGHIHYVVTQNIDGLHVRSGFPRNRLSILHGDMFIESCDTCATQYIGAHCVRTMALRPTGNKCTQLKSRGICRGKLHDTILDWEDSLPDIDLDAAEKNAKAADLHLCLGTSLQIQPAASLPLKGQRNRRLAIVNLQQTPVDKKCGLKIRWYVDDIMRAVCQKLSVEVPDMDKFPVIRLLSTHTTSRDRRLRVEVRTEEIEAVGGVVLDKRGNNYTAGGEQVKSDVGHGKIKSKLEPNHKYDLIVKNEETDTNIYIKDEPSKQCASDSSAGSNTSDLLEIKEVVPRLINTVGQDSQSLLAVQSDLHKNMVNSTDVKNVSYDTKTHDLLSSDDYNYGGNVKKPKLDDNSQA